MTYGWISELSEAVQPFAQLVENARSNEQPGSGRGARAAIDDANIALHNVGLTFDEVERLVQAVTCVLENEQ